MITLKNNKIILNGDIKGFIDNGAYHTIRNPNKHFYRIVGGYPISTEILDWLDEHGISKIKITEKNWDMITRYNATTSQYLDGKLVSHPGFDEQKCVPLDELNKFKED